MATKKKRKSRRRTRRGGIHGLSVKAATNQLEPILGNIAGGFAAMFITNKLLAKSTMDDKFKALIPAFGGLAIKMMMPKPGIMGNIAEGMIVVGGTNAVRMMVPGIAEITDEDISGIEEDILTVTGAEQEGYSGLSERTLTISGSESYD